MKINVAPIIKEHLDTLYNSRSKRLSVADIILFYGLPIIAAVFSYHCKLSLQPDAYEISITFFGIFIALILNIQVAVFAIFQRKWDIPSDERVAQLMSKTLADRKKLLREINANLSYLILICCVALVLSLLSFVALFSSNSIISAAIALLYVHFLLTLIMVIKRAHVLFQKEYRDSPE